MPRKGGGEGKYRSLKTGKYVSTYYGKRNPKHAYKVEPKQEEADHSPKDTPPSRLSLEKQATDDAPLESQGPAQTDRRAKT